MNAASDGNMAERAYEYVQQLILSGALPSGAVISEAKLAARLGFSRTPVGKAVRALVTEGLLEQIPRFGTVVRGVSRRDLVELYELREALESYAAGKAAGRIDDTQLARLDALCRAMRDTAEPMRRDGTGELADAALQTFLAADFSFHLLIIHASGNREIVRQVKRTRMIARIFETRRQKHDAALVEQAHDEHQRIVKALRLRDTAKVAETMGRHIASSKAQALHAFDALEHGEDDGHESFTSVLPESLRLELERIERLADDNDTPTGSA